MSFNYFYVLTNQMVYSMNNIAVNNTVGIWTHSHRNTCVK